MKFFFYFWWFLSAYEEKNQLDQAFCHPCINRYKMYRYTMYSWNEDKSYRVSQSTDETQSSETPKLAWALFLWVGWVVRASSEYEYSETLGLFKRFTHTITMGSNNEIV